jgi:hypothetical protein
MLFVLPALLACQDYAVKGHESGAESGAATIPRAGPRASFSVVVRDMYSGTWTDGVVDRSRPCYAETGAGTKYLGCCPSGFTPVSWTAWVGYDERIAVECLEDAPGTGRAVFVAGTAIDPFINEWDDDWGESPSSVGGGTWSGGTYTTASCAVDVRDDALDTPNLPNPPDDFSRCCPEGFQAVGQAYAGLVQDVVCLESL